MAGALIGFLACVLGAVFWVSSMSSKHTDSGVTAKRSAPRQAPSPTKEPRSEPPLAVAPFNAETAKQHQRAWAEYLGVPVEMTNSIGMRFVLIPPGEFDMGSTQEEVSRLHSEAKQRGWPQWYIDGLPCEAPRQRARFLRAFYLGVCEVTQAQYERVMGSNPSALKTSGPTAPVVRVSWDDAAEFCRRLSVRAEEKTAKYRLPTEAEWEYACRGGTIAAWSFGDDEVELSSYAWCAENSDGKTHPVGQKKPNPFGLHDVHGNAWEWCLDWYDEDTQAESPPSNPSNASARTIRAFRGGSYYEQAGGCRSACRGKAPPSFQAGNLGFRVGLGLSAKSIGEVRSTKESETSEETDPTRAEDSRAKVKSPEEKPVPPAARKTRSAPPLAIAPFDAQQAKGHQQAWAEYRGIPVETINSIAMKFMLIPPGEFVMGSPKSEKDRKDFEGQHRVCITKAFYLGAHEVTQAEYQQVMGTKPSKFKGDSRRPVESVTWENARAFCRKLNGIQMERFSRWEYRLPTEAEWEYACRSGTMTVFHYGNSVSSAQANIRGDKPYGNAPRGRNLQRTTAVGSYRPNAWGLYDMHGNVWEWCQDWFGEDYYQKSPLEDPPGPSRGTDRVGRGGGWFFGGIACRSAYRNRISPSKTIGSVGFRVALVPPRE
jgi:formylglycine-generating enzyme required for sulfatase activity